MLRNYIIIALRNLRKQPLYSTINVLGLTLAVSSALLLLLYVTDELSYDRYHEQAGRIYRVAMDVQMGDDIREVAVAPAALSPTLADRYPEIEQYALIRPINDFKVVHREETIPQADVFYGSATVFDVFSFPLLAGDPATALAEPNSIVIDQSMADRYFPGQDALGETLVQDDGTLYRVTGVMESIRANGHFIPQALVSIWDKEKTTSWGDWNWANYVLASPTFRPDTFQEELKTVFQTHMAEALAERNGSITFVMQPLTDIHFYSRRDFELRVNDGNMGYVYSFLITAGLLLLVAGINYTNLATARSLKRAREVGVRKALGSLRRQLVLQFLTESYGVVFIAVILGLLLTVGLLPFFHQFTQKDIPLTFFVNPIYLLGIPGLAVLLGTIAGGYPAFLLSRFQPVNVLKGSTSAGKSTHYSFRQLLVIFQFTVSVVMLIGTLVIYHQLRFLNRQSLGFNPEQIITLSLSSEAWQHFSPLKEALLADSHIRQVATTAYIPGQKPEINDFRVESDEGSQNRIFQQNWVDQAFVPTLGLPMLQGRNFYHRSPDDTTNAGLLVNETLVHAMGWKLEEAVGKKLASGNWEDEVIGVVQDFHMLSLHDVIEPLVLRYANPAGQVLIRVEAEDMSQTLDQLHQTWEGIVGKTALDYRFLDQQFQRQYEQDEKRGTLFAGFSLLTMTIACLGLFGLSSYTIHQRTKEIGIRKVLGASLGQLSYLLVRSYLRLMLIALIIGIPIANYVMSEWLENFAYRSPIHWWFFLLPALITLLIALLSVGRQTIQATRVNPADSLRQE